MTERVESPELGAFRGAVRAWLADHVEPLPRRSDGTVIVPDQSEVTPAQLATARAQQRMLCEAGWAGITYPVEYGGRGLSLDHEAVYQQESAAYDVPTQVFAVSLNILGPTLVAFGSEEQKRLHVPRLLAGEELWIQLLSEPSGGSDLAGLLTRAERDGDHYILNGQKTWSTGAQHSDFALCPARTRWDVPKHKGISMFILDLRWPGIEIRPIRQINGGADFCEEFLSDVAVPAANLLGAESEGWRVVRGMLEIEHAWVGRSGGGTRRPTAVDDLVSLARRRGRDGDVSVRRRIAALHGAARVQELVAARVSNGMAEGKLHPGLGGILKLGTDVTAQRRAEVGLELAGPLGVAWPAGDSDEDWSRAYLTTRSLSIAGGSDEIQRNNVGERALDLPREPASDRDVPFDQVPHN